MNVLCVFVVYLGWDRSGEMEYVTEEGPFSGRREKMCFLHT